MIKILFVCHGNICRSPLAEYMFRDLCRKKGMEDNVSIASAATSREEIGHGVHSEVRKILKREGIDCSAKRARQMTKADYEEYDYLIVMDSMNVRNALRIIKEDPQHKLYRMLDITDHPRDIADPWYTGDFALTYKDVMEGADAWFQKLEEQGWQ